MNGVSALPNGVFHVAMGAGDMVMVSILDFVHRNARIATALGVVVLAVGTAGAIGWMTAPV